MSYTINDYISAGAWEQPSRTLKSSATSYPSTRIGAYTAAIWQYSSRTLTNQSSSSSVSSQSSQSSESSSSEGYSSLSSMSSLSSESSASSSSSSPSSWSSDSSSSSNDLQDPLLDPVAVHNSHPVVLVNGQDRGRIVKVDQVTYRYSEVKNYTGPVTITLESPYAHSEIRYTLNGKNPNPSSRLYTVPLVFRQNASGSDNTVIKARIYDKSNSNKKSQIIRMEFRVVN